MALRERGRESETVVLGVGRAAAASVVRALTGFSARLVLVVESPRTRAVCFAANPASVVSIVLSARRAQGTTHRKEGQRVQGSGVVAVYSSSISSALSLRKLIMLSNAVPGGRV